MKINEGDKVGVIINGEIKKGVVISVYTDLAYAIVKFDNETRKVMLHDIGLLPEEKDRDHKDSKYPVEKSEITITPAEFREVACDVIAKRTSNNLPLGLLMTNILASIHEALFIEGENE